MKIQKWWVPSKVAAKTQNQKSQNKLRHAFLIEKKQLSMTLKALYVSPTRALEKEVTDSLKNLPAANFVFTQ